jgi:hypothetical protein
VEDMMTTNDAEERAGRRREVRGGFWPDPSDRAAVGVRRKYFEAITSNLCRANIDTPCTSPREMNSKETNAGRI